MSVLPFFGKIHFEKHKTGLFLTTHLRRTILENTNFTLLEEIQLFLLLFPFFVLSIPAV